MFNPEPSAVRVSRQLSRMPKVVSRIGRADGGMIPDDPSMPFTGALASPVAGRTDHIPIHVPGGSYVIPADIVSAVGEGNSLNGLEVLKRMFTASPYGATAGPWGSQLPKAAPGRGLGIPRPPAPYARGGKAVAGLGHPTPIAAAGGEFVVHPNDVARIGEGDIHKGHKALDQFVKNIRSKTIDTLKKLPGPQVT